MSASVALSHLLAIAVVRRLLLELQAFEEQDASLLLGQPIEVWVARATDDFNGLTPAQVLAAPGGDVIMRSWLWSRLR